jgi:hypothetical protein
MGEAIARFREMVLAMRQSADAAFIHPAYLLLGLPPTKAAAIESRLLAGKVQPREFARLLREAAKKSSRAGRPDASEDGFGMFDHQRKKMLSRAPGSRDLDRMHAAALRESEDAGRLFDLIEQRLSTLSDTTASLLAMAADSWGSQYSLVKRDYAKHLLQWQRAYDALGRFIELPPAASGTTSTAKTKPAKRTKKRSRKGIGGKPAKYSLAFIREVVDARERDEKQAAKTKQPLPPFSRWFSEYCSDHEIRIESEFPPAFKGEPWQARANRFWRAAKARLRRSGN